MVTVTYGRFAGMNVNDTNSLNRQYEDYIAANVMSEADIAALRDEKNRAIAALRGTEADRPMIRQETIQAMEQQQMRTVHAEQSGWPSAGTPTPAIGGPQTYARPLEVSVMSPSEAVASGSGKAVIESAVAYSAAGIEAVPMTEREGYVSEARLRDERKNAQIIFERSDPLNTAALALAPMWSDRGFEYMFSNLGYGVGLADKHPKEYIIDYMARSQLDRNFVKNQAFGSVMNTPTGVAGLYGAAGGLIGKVAGGAAGLIGSSSTKLASLGGAFNTPTASKIITYGLGGLAIGVEGMKISAMSAAGAPKESMAGEVAKDVVSFTSLGYGFQQGFKSGTGISRIGKEKVPYSSVTSEPVMKGEVIYPTTRPQDPNYMIGLFKESKYTQSIIGQGKFGGIHTTGAVTLSKSFTAQAGSSEAPGMFIGTEAIPNYLRVSGSSSAALPAKTVMFSQPKIWGIETPMAQRIPSGIRRQGEKAMAEFLGSGAKKGVPVVSPAYELGKKTEIELILPPGTMVKRTSKGLMGYEKYTVINDIPVPIFTGTTKTAQTAGKATTSIRRLGGISGTSYSAQVSDALIGSSVARLSSPLSSPSRVSSPLMSSSPRTSSPSPSKSLSSISSSPSSSRISSPSSSSFPSSPSFVSSPSAPSTPSRPSSPSYSSSPSAPSRPIISPPTRVSFPGAYGSRQRPRRMVKLSRRTRYAPSIGGILLGKNVGKTPTKRFTGLEIRPVVVRKRK